MISLRNKKNVKKRMIFLGMIAALFLILVIFKNFTVNIISESAMIIGHPFFQMSGSIEKWLGGKIFIIKEKKSLEKENIRLKAKIAELEAKSLFYKIIEKQNEELKSILLRPNLFAQKSKKEYLAASILSRPPQSPYDILIIDAGSNEGVEKGMTATAYGNVFLGYVSEVFSKTSKIKMISFPKEEMNVSINNSEGGEVAAVAIGAGGENFEITLPRSVKVSSGEIIRTLGINSLVLGIIEQIKIDPANPFQKILFRLPVNIRELQYVTIKLH